ncbi:hypothetical protein V8E55_006552 [Tylopilus felleus]
MATSLHKRAHAPAIIRTPTKSLPLTLVEPPTRTLCEKVGAPTCTRSRFYESGAAALVIKNRENDRENVVLGDVPVASVSSSSSALSASHVKARNRAPDELRRPLIPMAVVRKNLEEGADADVWVDTNVDEDVSVASEREVMLNLNSPERNAFA